MDACFCVEIFTAASLTKHEIELFTAEHWTTETETILMQRVHELLSVVRSFGKSLHLNLNIEVSDVATVIFTINKKLKNGREINTQKLTVREIEVLGLIMQGFTNNEIAEKLFISYETVKSHRKNLLIKTGAKNTASLINYYHQTFFEK